jgi:hypothetical protein
MGATAFSTRYPPNSIEPDQIAACDRNIPETNRLWCARASSQTGSEWASARSEHPGGVVAAHADTSIHFYTNDVEPAVWKALGSRSGLDSVLQP